MYVELNSFQPSIFVGKEVNMDACNAVQDRIEMIENVETEVTVKWRKMEDPAEISYAKPCLDRTETENIHTGSKSNDDFRTQPRTALCTERDTTGYWLSEEETPFTHPSPNQSEEIQQKYNNPAALRKDYSHMSLWEPVVYNIEQGTETTQKEGKMQLQPQIIPTRPQENVESKRGGFLELLKRIKTDCGEAGRRRSNQQEFRPMRYWIATFFDQRNIRCSVDVATSRTQR
nr:uncharacterized protein LOC102447896 isoform X3 [Pelodiscus sinensis]|eukprot:XP_025034252.1 uncharacterized protein LOC102447896 isoform X3 [Pelodiscus sinensis]